MHDNGYIIAMSGIACGLSIVVGLVNDCPAVFFVSLVLLIQMALVIFIDRLPSMVDGRLDIMDGEDRDLYRFSIDTPLDEIPLKRVVSFKVRDFREKSTHSNGE